jgi:hypothetical protein
VRAGFLAYLHGEFQFPKAELLRRLCDRTTTSEDYHWLDRRLAVGSTCRGERKTFHVTASSLFLPRRRSSVTVRTLVKTRSKRSMIRVSRKLSTVRPPLAVIEPDPMVVSTLPSSCRARAFLTRDADVVAETSAVSCGEGFIAGLVESNFPKSFHQLRFSSSSRAGRD